MRTKKTIGGIAVCECDHRYAPRLLWAVRELSVRVRCRACGAEGPSVDRPEGTEKEKARSMAIELWNQERGK